MMKKNWKKALSLMCAMALLLGMVVLPASAEEDYQKVTFADFGVSDSTTIVDGQTWGELPAYTDVNSLAGLAFEGYITLGYTEAHPLTSAHVFGKDAGGIGVFADGPENIGVGIYNVDGTKNVTVVSVPAANYNISFTEGVGFSEFEICIKIKAISGNNVDLVIDLNDQQIYDGTVEGVASLLGPKVFVWGFNAPVAVRSTYEAPADVTYTQATFSDFGMDDQTFTDAQKTGRPTELTTLNDVCISGMLKMGYHGNDVMHSIRFGQSEDAGSTCWNGIGFYAKSETELVLADFVNYNDRKIIKALNIADYDITYADGTFSEFEFALKFHNISGTSHVWVEATINDQAFYSGLIANLQNTLGCNIQLWANGASIRVKSYVPEVEDPTVYQTVTFADFDMNDGTAIIDRQLWGQLASYTDINSLVGLAFEGYVTLGYTEAFPYTAAHVFGRDAGGIAVFADGPENIGVGAYNVDGTKNTTIVSVPASNYDIYLTEGVGFTEFKLGVKIKAISGSDVELVIELNDQVIFEGTVAGVASLLGPRAFVWGFNAPISIRSTYEAPADATYNQITFADYAIADQVFANGAQKTGRPVQAMTSLDGIRFVGKLQLGYNGNDVMNSIRFGQSEAEGSTGWNGIGFYAMSENQIVLADYVNYNDREVIEVINIADYNITYADGKFSEFDFAIEFKNIADTRHMWVIVTINGLDFYSGVITNAQDSFGCNIQLWANGADMGVKSEFSVDTPDGPYTVVTFRDYGVVDQTFNGESWAQKTGRPEFTSLDGIAFKGMLTMGCPTADNAQNSFRIGGCEEDVWKGIGLWTKDENTLVLRDYSNHVNGTDLTEIAIADYGITCTDGQYSRFTLCMMFSNIADTRNMKLVVTINGMECYRGALLGAQDTYGAYIQLWACNADMTVNSVATDDEIVKWNLTLGDQIGANFCVKVEDAANTQVKFTIADNVQVLNASDAAVNEEGYYVFSANVAAAQMMDTIAVEVLVGGEVVDSGEYTVRQYADIIRAGYFTNQEKALVKEMLNYGAAAQTYFNYNTENLSNNGIIVQSAEVPKEKINMDVSGSIPGVTVYGATLVFESKIAVRIYFTGDITACTFKVGDQVLTPVEKDGMWYVEVAGINPQDLDEMITVNVSDALTVSYSPMCYITRMYNSQSSSQELKDLLQALYGYHLAATDLVNGTEISKKNLITMNLLQK